MKTRCALKTISLAVILCSLCLQAGAALLYTQPADSSGTRYKSAWYPPDGLDGDVYAYDSFILSSNQAIAEIQWRGGYNNFLSGAGQSPVFDFTISLYASIAAGIQPDVIAPALVRYSVGSNAGETLAGTFGGIPLYDYHFVLPSPFQAVAGVKYWLQIEASQGVTPTYGWPPDWSIAAGAGPDNSHFEMIRGGTLAGGNRYVTMGGDLAFTLLGSDVPMVAIAATASPNGSGTVSGAGPYPVGTTASLAATPSAGFGFLNWTENGVSVSTSAQYNFAVSTNRNLVANFAPAFSITTSASPNYGGSTTGNGLYTSNASVTVVASPVAGYTFINWTEFGTEVSTSSSYTFNASANRALVANFTSTGAISIFNFDHGNPPVSEYGGMPGSQSDNGLIANFSAPSGAYSIQRYVFSFWKPALFSGLFLWPNSPGTTLQIQFSEAITNISFAFCTDDISSEFDIASTVSITAYTNSTAAPALGTASMKGAWTSGAYPEGTLTFASSTPFNIVRMKIAAGQTASLLFVDNIITQRAPPPSYLVNASASPVNAGTISGTGAYSTGATANLTATPNANYAFVNWTEGGVEVSTMAAYSFTVEANRTLVANFAPACTITANVLPANGGTITGDGIYAIGSSVMLFASPYPGFAFVNWSENGIRVCTWPSYAIVASTNQTLTAVFAPAWTLTTSSADIMTGTSSGDGIYPEGATVAIVAVPQTGYRFGNWTENGAPISSSANYSFSITTNRNFLANFAPDNTSFTFDFDTATPALAVNQMIPFAQTNGVLAAQFSSPSGSAFTIQSDFSIGWSMSRFSGNYLFSGGASTLEIQFNQPLSSITMTFATGDFQDILTPSAVLLEAFRNTTNTQVTTATAIGAHNPADPMPMGQIALRSVTPFDLVRISVSPGLFSATELLADNITATVMPVLKIHPTATNTSILSWSTNSDGFTLQQNNSLITTNWESVTNVPMAIGVSNQVELPAVDSFGFFRLYRP